MQTMLGGKLAPEPEGDGQSEQALRDLDASLSPLLTKKKAILYVQVINISKILITRKKSNI